METQLHIPILLPVNAQTVHPVTWEQKQLLVVAGIAIILIFLAKPVAVQAVITAIQPMPVHLTITILIIQVKTTATPTPAVHANIKELCLMPELFFLTKQH